MRRYLLRRMSLDMAQLGSPACPLGCPLSGPKLPSAWARWTAGFAPTRTSRVGGTYSAHTALFSPHSNPGWSRSTAPSLHREFQTCSSVLEPHRDATTRRVEPENVAPAIAIEVAGPRAHPVRTDVAASSATNRHTAPNGFQSIPKVEIGLDAWYEATSFEVEAAAVRRLNKAALDKCGLPAVRLLFAAFSLA